MLKKWFNDSETILWARLQAVVGAALEIITVLDPSLVAGVMPNRWFPWYMLGAGILTEVLRRRRATDL